ncbi:N-acyl homoserine lactonase family protein [Streptomyces sp. NPDC004838]
MAAPTESGVAPWEITALRFARLSRHHRDALLMCPEPLAGRPLEMDYSLWVLRRGDETVVVDTGYSPELAARRGRTFLHDPMALLRQVGVDPAAVTDVVLTHLHYDHAGNLDHFPAARLHLHERELGPATGWHAHEPAVSFAYEPDHVAAVGRARHEGRLRLLEGDTPLRDGIQLIHLPGHTPGHMAVRVLTRRGWVLLTGDAVHVHANLKQRRPYPLYTSLEDTFRDYDKITALSESPDHVIPGHDASVIERFPAAAPELVGRAARLDLPPESEL